jgi:hypothetical protein
VYIHFSNLSIDELFESLHLEGCGIEHQRVEPSVYSYIIIITITTSSGMNNA